MKLKTVYAAILILLSHTTLVNTQEPSPEADLGTLSPDVNQTEDDVPTLDLNANGTIELGLIEVPVNHTENNTTGIDTKDGTDDSLADYVIKKVGEMLTGNTDADEEGTQGDVDIIDNEDGELAEERNNNTLIDLEEELEKEEDECKTPDTIDRYNCTLIPDAVREYFGGNMTATSLLNQLFRPDIMDQLSNCTPGSWCLPFETHVEVKLSLSVFYKYGPFCSDAMRCSLNMMLEKRYICDEPALVFLANAVELMCDLKLTEDRDEGIKCDDVDECYTRTKEALYTLYQDIITPTQEHQDALLRDDCNSYKVEVAKSYLCADKCCQFAQQELLRRFELWDGLADTAGDITSICNITDSCEVNRREMVIQTPEVNEYFSDYEDGNSTDGYYDATYYTPAVEREEDLEEEEEEAAKILDEELEAMNEMVDQLQNTNTESVGDSDQENMYTDFGDFSGMGMAESHSTSDTTMMFGVIVAAGIMVITLIFIIFVGFKRFRTRSLGFNSGYSRLSEEETRILRNEYN